MDEEDIKLAVIALDVSSHAVIDVMADPDISHPDVSYALESMPRSVLNFSFEESRWHFIQESARALSTACMRTAAAEAQMTSHTRAESPTKPSTMVVDEGLEEYFFIVSYPRRGHHITLHKRDGCYRRPGRELRNVSYHTTVTDSDYTSKCRGCFGGDASFAKGLVTQQTVQELADLDVDTEDEVTSSGSSSDGEKSISKIPAVLSKKAGEVEENEDEL